MNDQWEEKTDKSAWIADCDRYREVLEKIKLLTMVRSCQCGRDVHHIATKVLEGVRDTCPTCTCQVCKGTGGGNNDPCSNCQGQGGIGPCPDCKPKDGEG